MISLVEFNRALNVEKSGTCATIGVPKFPLQSALASAAAHRTAPSSNVDSYKKIQTALL